MLSAEQGLSRIDELGRREHFLAVVVTTQPSGELSTSVVNAGVLAHPLTGEPTVAFVSGGGTAKLANLRHTPAAALVFRAGWEWVAVHGTAEIIGPDDPAAGVDAERLRLLLREVYQAAGGAHDDYDEYDRAMREERRAAVLLRPTRFATNPR
jgi:PPOX class probable F420-dependent enzyme